MMRNKILRRGKSHTQLIALLLLTLFSVLCLAEKQDKDLFQFLNIKGELTQGSAITGQLPIGAKLLVNNKKILATDAGKFFVGFGRDADLNQTVHLTTNSGEVYIDTFNLVAREYKLQKVNGVPQKTVSPNKKNLKRISQENAQVKQAREVVSSKPYFLEKFIAPMAGPITGVYGSQRIYNGVPKRPHYGVDYAGPVGALVYAPASGVVSLAHPDMFYSGGTLIIDHGFGVSSSFLHLSEIIVTEGQQIKQGDPIAKVGKGGRASGPHLDWRMNWFDVRIDPLKVIEINKDAVNNP
jgi:murein DD-endopeptidase MepM/ murein hydrolase activator NlpD